MFSQKRTVPPPGGHINAYYGRAFSFEAGALAGWRWRALESLGETERYVLARAFFAVAPRRHQILRMLPTTFGDQFFRKQQRGTAQPKLFLSTTSLRNVVCVVYVLRSERYQRNKRTTSLSLRATCGRARTHQNSTKCKNFRM